MFEQNGGLVLQEHISSQPGNTFKIFSESELVKATDGFHDDRIIGRGGYGVKSRIMDERESKEFAREMAILSQINHFNVVKILGCCLEVEVPMLVYEFVPGGTLFGLIHRRRSGEPIALATPLAYLHSYASPPIFHKDVKTSNILLDGNCRAKVSDFGASAVAPADEAEVATVVHGTCGYLDPEYLQTYQFTEKSDVYIFGVVLVELLTGRKPFQAQDAGDHRGLAMTFVSYFRHDRLAEILDADVLQDDQMERLVDIAELACRCLSMRGFDRPTMKEVTIALHAMGGLPWENPSLTPYTPEGTDNQLGQGQSTAYGNMYSGIPDDSAVLGIKTGH
ncbi:unnamed protein product [Spirodela intermedia]|nr:unnamed protein product [Spirodela intermedia]